MKIEERINRLLYEMRKESIDYYIIPTSDYHNSEYISDFFKCREYMSGFTGSAGTLVVSEAETILWTDGRYFIQAEDQLKNTGIKLYKSGNEGVPTIKEYLKKQCEGSQNLTIGFDGKVMDLSFVKALEKELSELGGISISINPTLDLVGRIWSDRPQIVANEIKIFPEEYAGKSASEKLNEVRLKLSEKNVEYHVLASLDDIAWLLNLRGSDIECNPVFLAYVFISEDDAILFCHTEKVFRETKDYLSLILGSLHETDAIASYREVSRGGLFGTLLQCTPESVGFDILSYREVRLDAFLFGEQGARYVAALEEPQEDFFLQKLVEARLNCCFLGRTTKGRILVDGMDFGDRRQYSLIS